MDTKKYNCLILHDLEATARPLSASLEATKMATQIIKVKTVASAWKYLQKRDIDILFIRIQYWDEYRHRRSRLKNPPPNIVFLPDAYSKRFDRLHEELVFLLRRPYGTEPLLALFRKIGQPGFVPRSQDFFFIVLNRKHYIIPLSDLRGAEVSRPYYILLHTDSASYEVRESLYSFENRLNHILVRINRSQSIISLNPAEIDPSILSRSRRRVLGIKIRRTRFTADPEVIAEAVRMLPPQQKMIWELGQEQQLSYNQIASKMGVSRNTIRNHMTRAIRTVRSYLHTHSANQA